MGCWIFVLTAQDRNKWSTSDGQRITLIVWDSRIMSERPYYHPMDRLDSRLIIGRLLLVFFLRWRKQQWIGVCRVHWARSSNSQHRWRWQWNFPKWQLRHVLLLCHSKVKVVSPILWSEANIHDVRFPSYVIGPHHPKVISPPFCTRHPTSNSDFSTHHYSTFPKTVPGNFVPHNGC